MVKKIIVLLVLSIQSAFAANVGLLVMATGKYISFVDPLIASAEKHFCKNHNVTYFIFTDANRLSTGNTIYIYQQKLGWPYDSMMRHHTYSNNRDAFAGQDYLFATDADMLFVGTVGDEILGKRVATLHPGFYNKPRRDFSYETNSASLAYIAPKEGKHYFAGGFYGGTRKEFLNIVQTCSERSTHDLNRGLIAVWHDESHWNRYCIDHKPTVILSPSYCYPGVLSIPYEKKLIALDKNHKEMRE